VQSALSALAVHADRQQSRAAFLHEAPLARRDESTFEHGMRGADARMARKGQFLARGEDAQTVVRSDLGRRQHEGGFGQVEPSGDGLHGGASEICGIEYNSERIAAAGFTRENVELEEIALLHPKSVRRADRARQDEIPDRRMRMATRDAQLVSESEVGDGRGRELLGPSWASPCGPASGGSELVPTISVARTGSVRAWEWSCMDPRGGALALTARAAASAINESAARGAANHRQVPIHRE
jgi:hypothetical protein